MLCHSTDRFRAKKQLLKGGKTYRLIVLNNKINQLLIAFCDWPGCDDNDSVLSWWSCPVSGTNIDFNIFSTKDLELSDSRF